MVIFTTASGVILARDFHHKATRPKFPAAKLGNSYFGDPVSSSASTFLSSGWADERRDQLW
jgi:hypothetical protein